VLAQRLDGLLAAERRGGAAHLVDVGERGAALARGGGEPAVDHLLEDRARR
jgi:hypothetical protein